MSLTSAPQHGPETYTVTSEPEAGDPEAAPEGERYVCHIVIIPSVATSLSTSPPVF